MATHDESHMFSLAALTERSPSPVLVPKRAAPDPDSLDLVELARARSFGADFGPPVYPLAGPPADSEWVDAAQARRNPAVQLVFIVGALLLAAGIIATAVWFVQTPTPPSPLTAPGAAPPRLEPLPKPETQIQGPTEPSQRVGALAEPAPSSAASSGRPSTADTGSSPARHPSKRARPLASPTPPTRVPSARPRPAGPCAHCSPQDLACNIKCRAN